MLNPRNLQNQIEASICKSKKFIDTYLLLHPDVLSFLTNGKRLRSKFILHSKWNQNQKLVKALASLVELTHASSLIHDDIVDESSFRRGLPTAFRLLPVPYACSIGYLLFSTIFLRIIQMKNHIFEHYFQTVTDMCIGQIQEIESSHVQYRTLDQYFECIKNKTASLFSFSFGVADKEWDQDKAKIGLKFGIAFQVLDDLYDVTLSTQKTGKPILQDEKSGVMTLPFILMGKRHGTSLNQDVIDESKKIALDFLPVDPIPIFPIEWKKEFQLLSDKINRVFYCTSHTLSNTENNKNFPLSDQTGE